jgi:hypothetical protein
MKYNWLISRRSLLKLLSASLTVPGLNLLARFNPAQSTLMPSESNLGLQNQTTIAFVLSGGGARGDFQVGVMRYLYDQGIRPSIVCTTSVGSINGIKIAEGEGDPQQGLRGLEQIWLQKMNSNGDMYLPEDWFRNLQGSRAGNALLSLLFDEAGPTLLPLGPWDILFAFPVLLKVGFTAADIASVSESRIGVTRTRKWQGVGDNSAPPPARAACEKWQSAAARV